MIKVKNWQEFQHYKDRNPPWIKLSTLLFQDYDFCDLSDASKLLAICIWTLASRYKDPKKGLVPNDMKWIKRQCNLSDNIKEEHLQELEKAGFIVIESKPLAPCKQNARPEERRGEHIDKKNITKKNEEKEEPEKEISDFDQFWNAYPKKTGMGSARTQFSNQIFLKKADPKQMIKAAKAYAKSRETEDKTFTLNPAKFLESQTYLDPELNNEGTKALIEDIDESELNDYQKKLLKHFGIVVFRTWFYECEIKDQTIITNTKFQSDWIKNHYMIDLEKIGFKAVVVNSN